MSKIIKIVSRDKGKASRKRLQQQLRGELLLGSVEQARESHIGSRSAFYSNRPIGYTYGR
jgi:hypothetical protein